MGTHAMTSEFNTKVFKAKGENIKQAIGIQSAFMLEISLQTNIFNEI